MRLSPIALSAVLTLTGAAAYAENAFDAAPTESYATEAAIDAATEAATKTVTEAASDAATETMTEVVTEATAAVEEAATVASPREAAAQPVAALDPAAPVDPAEATEAAAPTAASLGPIGYDAEGEPGRVHVVVGGDTLWDISDAYLGTPWVWPSIWTDNAAIANPHLIHPGDRIWITPTEMRKITAEEAEALLANGPPSQAPAEAALPASFSDAMSNSLNGAPTYRYTEIQTAGFVTHERYEGAATILDSAVPRVWLGDHDEVHIGFGVDEVAVGDEFEIFRPMEKVVDPETGRSMGWATNVLGWLRVKAVHAESATGTIRLSRSEIRRGDYLLPRPPVIAEIPVADRPEIAGRIIHTPHWRTEMGSTDVVYLDRGAADGLEVGSPLEVFRPMGSEVDALRGDERELPDEVVAKMIVVQATPEAAVAVITHTKGELTRGDRFRGSDTLGP